VKTVLRKVKSVNLLITVLLATRMFYL